MKYKILLLSVLGLMTHMSAVNAANDKSTVIYPLWIESAPSDANVDAANWYLKNFTTFNSKTADNSRSPRGASDNDYKSRLKDLSKQLKMDLPYNETVKKYIELYVVKNRTQVSNMLGLWPYYKPIFENAIRSNRLPEAIKYLPVACSALNSQAISGEGSAGLWMFMITPAKGNGLEVNTIVDERFDPYRSSEKAAEYLKKLNSSYNDWLLAIAAHTCGISNVNKAIQRAKNQKIKDPKFWDIYKYLPKSTRGYVPAFIAACYAMNYFSDHDITPTLTNRKLETATAPVNNRVSIHQISQVLGIDQNEIRFLNPQYREEVNDIIVIPGNIRTYNLTLPSGQIESFRIAEKQIANYQKKQFARRAEVQPGDIKSVVGDEDDIIDDGIIYHEVTGIEDLEDIAKTYNVNINAITMTDGQSKPFSVEAGDIVLIHTKGNKGRKSKPEKYAYNTDSNHSNSNSKTGRNNSSSSHNNSSGFDDDYVAQNTTDNEGRDKRSVPQPQRSSKNNQSSSSYDDYDYDDNNQSYDEDLEREKQEAAARKKAAEEAKKRKAAEEAMKKKKAAEEARKKKAAEEAAKRKAAEEAAKKKAAEEAAKRKAAEEAAKKKAAEDAAKRKAAEEAAKPIVYEVQPGNNLTKLAEQHGITVNDILDANPEIKDGNIKIGQKIKIPKKGHTGTASTKNANNKGNDAAAKKKAAEDAAKKKAAEEASKPIVYEVKSGNNLTKLAEQHGVTVNDILEANPEIKDGNIKIGQKIKIPKKGQAGTASTRKVNNEDDAAAKKKAAEDAAKKKADEEAAKKKAAEDAAKKKAAEEAAKKKAAKEAAKKKELERKEEAKKKAAEEAKKKAAEEAAKKKAAEEAARKKAAEEAKKPINHKVSDGENLTKIAKRYGVSVQELKRHNNITDENKVRSGSTLKIPKKQGTK